MGAIIYVTVFARSADLQTTGAAAVDDVRVVAGASVTFGGVNGDFVESRMKPPRHAVPRVAKKLNSGGVSRPESNNAKECMMSLFVGQSRKITGCCLIPNDQVDRCFAWRRRNTGYVEMWIWHSVGIEMENEGGAAWARDSTVIERGEVRRS